MKNICFIVYDISVLGGAEKVTNTLANALGKKYKTYVISLFGKGKNIPYQFDTNVEVICLFEEELRIRKAITGVYNPLKKILKEKNISWALTMGNYPGVITAPVALTSKTKFAFCDHGALMNQWHQRDIRYIRLISAKVSNRVVTLTARSQKDYIKKFHLKEKKVICIYNNIDENTIKNAGSYNRNSRCILSAGRFGKEKGYDMLVNVAAKVFEKETDWQWHIYGDGETFDEIKKQIEEKGLSDKLVLKGAVNNMPQLYKEYGIFVLTSYREGLPLVLLEAKANQLPIVSFNCMTGPAEIISDNENGYLVEPYDTDIMAERILKLMNDNELREKFSKNSEKDMYKFSQDNVINQWIKLIESEK